MVRVTAGDQIGWGECEAAPLPSIAAFVCPMSHGACRPVSTSVLGQKLESPEDIQRIAALVAYDSMDLLQAAHTFSGIEMALWDVLGRQLDAPVWSLLGYSRSEAKIPYASMLFGDTPQETLDRAQKALSEGFTAFKFGWCIFRDIRPPIPTTSAHLYRGIRPALTRCREALVFDISFLAFRHVVEGLSFGRIVRRVRAGRRCAPAGRGWHLRRWVHQ